jgi:5-methylcytosine-specific restriction endonuclease McrA
VTPIDDKLRRKMLAGAFAMPSVQTMVSRKSSITNAFVNSVIPAIAPTHEDVEEALKVLAIQPDDVRCAYCGNKATEWDHLRPLVLKRRPTGYVTEIANLVPACGKCNQSKGNKPWREWMLSTAKHSPAGRNIADLNDRVMRLEAFERWRPATKIDLEAIVGTEDWEAYWSLCENVIDELRRCQQVADELRRRVLEFLERNASSTR